MWFAPMAAIYQASRASFWRMVAHQEATVDKVKSLVGSICTIFLDDLRIAIKGLQYIQVTLQDTPHGSEGRPQGPSMARTA